ncbi:MAG: arginine--tRNA ligase, partial [Methanofollis sp.]|nr:arginine--tRNA ligase [Methanofollis sp.]
MFLETYRQIEEALRACTGEETVELTDGGEHADYATTVAFSLAKKLRKSPMVIATELAAELTGRLADAGITVETKGPYINFHVSAAYVQDAVREALEPGYGKLPAHAGKVILEHTSANPNGPLHVGHIRNSIIGDTLAR